MVQFVEKCKEFIFISFNPPPHPSYPTNCIEKYIYFSYFEICKIFLDCLFLITLMDSLIDKDPVEGVPPVLHDWLQVLGKSLMDVCWLDQIHVLQLGSKVLHQRLHGVARDKSKPIKFQVLLKDGVKIKHLKLKFIFCIRTWNKPFTLPRIIAIYWKSLIFFYILTPSFIASRFSVGVKHCFVEDSVKQIEVWTSLSELRRQRNTKAARDVISLGPKWWVSQDQSDATHGNIYWPLSV